MKIFLSISFLFLTLACYSQFSERIQISKFYDNSIVRTFDVDNDGDQDLIIGSITNSYVSINKNDGLGNFTESQIFNDSLPQESLNLIFGDIDQDGWTDLVVMIYDGSHKLVKYKNNGGTFLEKEVIYTYSSNYSWGSICFTKFNGDAYPDIAINQHSGTSILANLNGTFENELLISTFDELGGPIKSIDMDNDGDEDLLTSNQVDDYVVGESYPIAYVWLKNNGTFYTEEVYDAILSNYTYFNITDFFAYDLNNDQLPEYIQLSDFGDGLFWFDNTDPPYTFSGEYGIATSIISNDDFNLELDNFDMGDFNNDNYQDFITANGATIFISKNDGANHFTHDTIYRDINASYDAHLELQPADVNGDGLLDIFVSNFHDDAIFWLENIGNFNFRKNYIYYNSANPNKIYLMDVNGDGNKEVLSYDDRNGGAHTYLNDGNFTFEKHIPLIDSLYCGGKFYGFDVDSDGDRDLMIDGVFAHYVESENEVLQTEIGWFENTPINPFQTRRTIPTNIYFRWFVVEDLDSDGLSDIILYDNQSKIYVKYNEGNGVFSNEILVANLDPDGVAKILIFDFNGDQFKEILIITYNFYSKAFYLKNLGNRNFSNPILFEHPIDYYIELSIGDLNNDGLLDLFGGGNETYTDSISWLRNSGNFHFQIQNFLGEDNFVSFSNLGKSKIADLDLDGDVDVVFMVDTYFYWNDWYDGDRLYWLENLNGQEFVFHEIETEIDKLYDIELEDIDFDGDKDLFVTGEHDIVAFYRNDFVAPMKISGNLFLDQNENGIKDTDEPAFEFAKLKLIPSEVATFTNQEGDYFVSVDPGTYIIMPTDYDTILWEISTDSLQYNIIINAGQANYSNVDFGFAPKFVHGKLQTDIYSPQLICNRVANQKLLIKNIGTSFPMGNVSYKIDPLCEFDSLFPQPDSIIGNYAFWHFDSIDRQETFLINAFVKIPPVDFIGQDLNFKLETHLLGENAQIDSTYIDDLRMTIICAYDPNNKYGENNGYFQQNFILNDEDYIDYTINFQNTGTSSAEDVVLTDLLSSNLNWESMEVLSTSHQMNTELNEFGLVKFIFNDINLPDSNSNEVGSHGYVKFRIKLVENLQPNTEIKNFAAIYFDLNPPIITNTTLHTIFDCNWLKGIDANDFTFCSNEPIIIESTGSYIGAYEWRLDDTIVSNQNLFIIQNPINSTYSLNLKVTNPMCLSDTTFTINVIPYQNQDIIAVFDTIICGSLQLNSHSTNTLWFYNDSILASDSTLLVSETGSYVVVLQDDICPSFDTVNIEIKIDEINSITTQNGYSIICNEIPITLISNSLDSVFWTLNLDTVSFQSTVLAQQPGIYILHVLDEICGESTVEKIITSHYAQIATIEQDSVLYGCSIGTTPINSLYEGNYTWFYQNQAIGYTQSIVVSQEGLYRLVFSDNNCPSTEDSIYLFLEEPNVANINNLFNTPICQGDSTLLFTNPSDSLAWYSDGNLISYNDSLFVNQSNWYHLMVFNQYCADDSDSVFVFVEPSPPSDIGFYDISLCPGEVSVLSSATANCEWLFNNEVISTETTITVVDEGWYYLNTYGNVCLSVLDSVYIDVNSVPSNNILVFQNNNLSILSDQLEDYQWFFNGLFLSDENDSVIENPINGNYQAIVQFDNGCSQTYSYQVEQSSNELVENVQLDHIYPNPAGNFLIIEASEIEKVEIVNSIGQVVLFVETNNPKTKIDVRNLAEGVYYVVIDNFARKKISIVR